MDSAAAGTQSVQASVLFADLSGSTRLYESEGDKVALQAIGHCIHLLSQAVRHGGGRVVKTIGDAVMAEFATPDAAAMAAGGMQAAIDAMPPVGAYRLGLRVGFHAGPVLRADNDVFGDTVNLAARLAEQAGRNQIITSRETSDRLGPLFRAAKRPLYAIHVKGKAEEVELCEVIWRNGDPNLTMIPTRSAGPKSEARLLRLRYGDREVFRRRQDDVLSLGRDAACDVVVTSPRASRRHCGIERRQDKFVLSDLSTNGTYVTVEGGGEVLVRREELWIGSHGWIAFGQPRAEADAVAEYFCE
jgi:class 3 adenylate cyclase